MVPLLSTPMCISYEFQARLQAANVDITNENWGLWANLFIPSSSHSPPSFLIPTLPPIQSSPFIPTTSSIHSPPSFPF